MVTQGAEQVISQDAVSDETRLNIPRGHKHTLSLETAWVASDTHVRCVSESAYILTHSLTLCVLTGNLLQESYDVQMIFFLLMRQLTCIILIHHSKDNTQLSVDNYKNESTF